MVNYNSSEIQKWNDNGPIQNSHNCYSYFLNKLDSNNITKCKMTLANNKTRKKKFRCNTHQPGYHTGLTQKQYIKRRKPRTPSGFRYHCKDVLKLIKADNPKITILGSSRDAAHTKCHDNEYKGAVVTTSKDAWKHSDYHFYRQDDDNWWSHKDGRNPIKNVDASGKRIRDPFLANRKYKTNNYTDFCSYMCVPRNSEDKNFSATNNTPSRKVRKTRKRMNKSRKQNK